MTYLNIEHGNPSDKILYLPVLEACHEDYGQLPVATVADGGYASQANVEQARASGVKQSVLNNTRWIGFASDGREAENI